MSVLVAVAWTFFLVVVAMIAISFRPELGPFVLVGLSAALLVVIFSTKGDR